MQTLSRSVLPILCVALFSVVGCKSEKPIAFEEATAVYSNFSGDKTYAHLEKIVGFGERVAGSEQLKQSREYIVAELEKLGWGVLVEDFKLDTPIGEVEFFNIRARFSPDADADVWAKGVSGLICSHYDTKKFSFEKPFVGANDGGSSTAALIEIARVMAEKPELANRIELVWFDGEEAFGKSITDTDGLYGSKVYAVQMAMVPEDKRPKWGLLLDMIGDKDLKIRIGVHVQVPGLLEQKNADKSLPPVNFQLMEQKRRQLSSKVILAADQLGHRRKFGESPNYITDDHVPLNNIAGIPTIDIIDFDYDYWHTPGDSMDQISAENLEIVGQTTLLTIEKYLVTQSR